MKQYTDKQNENDTQKKCVPCCTPRKNYFALTALLVLGIAGGWFIENRFNLDTETLGVFAQYMLVTIGIVALGLYVSCKKAEFKKFCDKCRKSNET